MRKEKGITLVALVITIIILLILAGITISQLTENELFKKAKLAKEKSENAQKLENIKLADYENEIGEYINNDRANPSKSITKTLLFPATEDGSYANDPNETYNLNYTYKNYEYLLVEAEEAGSGSWTGTSTVWVPTDNILIVDSFLKNGTSHSSWSMWVATQYISWYFNSETSFKIGQKNANTAITHIYGIN